MPRSVGHPLRIVLAVVIAFLIPLGLMAIALASRDVIPRPKPRPGELPEMHWEPGPALATPRDDFGVAVVDNRIYALGGMTGERGNKLDTTEVYDTAAGGGWQAGPALPAGRSSFRAVALGRTIYAIGGSVGETSATDRVDALDVDTGRWTARAPLPTARFGHAVVALAGRIYAIGGSRRGESLGSVEVYDPAADRWSAAAPLPTPRYNLQAVALDGRIYALGGWVDGAASAVVEVYDPVADRWSGGPALRAPISNFGAAVLDGHIYALHHTISQVFDPAAKRWIVGNPMPTTRHGQGVAAVGGRLYAIGGCYEDPQYDLDVTEVLAPGPVLEPAPPPGARSRGGILALTIGILGTAVLVLVVNARTRRPPHSALED